VNQLHFKLFSVKKQLRYCACSDWPQTYNLLQCNWYLRHSNMIHLMMETKRRKTLITARKNLLFYLQLPIDSGSDNNCFINRLVIVFGKKRRLTRKGHLLSYRNLKLFSQINKHDGLQISSEFLATTSFRSRCFYFFQFQLTILATASSFTYQSVAFRWYTEFLAN